MTLLVQLVASLFTLGAANAAECPGHQCSFSANSLLQSKHSTASNFVVSGEDHGDHVKISDGVMMKNKRIRKGIRQFATVAGLDVEQDWKTPIPGHTAVGGQSLGFLRAVTQTHGPKGSPDTCEQLRAKFLNLIHADEDDGTADAAEEADEKVLKSGSAKGDERSLKAMYDLLSSKHMNLQEELKLGDFITHDDITNVWRCENGTAPLLDQSTDSDKLQGDMATPSSEKEKNAMLAQMKTALETGSLWYGQSWNTQNKLGRIPFCFHSSVNAKAKSATQQTVEMIRKQVPCMDLVEVDFDSDSIGNYGACKETPSIIVRSDNKGGNGCYSYVGMLDVNGGTNGGGSQLLNLDEGCEATGIVAHEFGHAFGMGHEHSRKDRDKYITVHEDFIEQTAGKAWVAQVKAKDGVDTSLPYDILSLMHYGAHNGWITVNADDDLTHVLGQEFGFSEYDIDQLGNMYSCRDKVTPSLSNAVLMDHAKFPGCYEANGEKKTFSDDSLCAEADCEKGAEWYDWAKIYCVALCGFCGDAPSPAGKRP